MQPLHTPPASGAGDPLVTQLWLEGQAWHANPCLPHSALVLPSRQLRPSAEQHPAQVAGWHTHEPFMQVCPGSQSRPPPQAQTPLLVQVSARTGSHAAQLRPPFPQVASAAGPRPAVPAVSQMLFLQQPSGHDTESHRQAPLTQCNPGPQAGPAPHEQVPSLHASAERGSHLMHTEPLLPQLLNPSG